MGFLRGGSFGAALYRLPGCARACAELRRLEAARFRQNSPLPAGVIMRD